MAVADVLDVPDKIASVVGAIAGVAALVIAIRDKPARLDATRDRRRRKWLQAALLAAAFLLITFAVRPVHLLPPWLAPTAAAVAAVATTVFLVGFLFSARTQVAPLMRQVLTLLEEYAVQHRHNFGDEHVPALDKIYVAQRASAKSASRVRLPLETMLEVASNALVVGGPGAGKSSMIMHVAYEGARGWRSGAPVDRSPFRDAIPMPADVATLAEIGVAAALSQFCATNLGIQVPRELFERPPGPRRRWLVLVDGLDEILDQDQRSHLLRRLAAVVVERDSPYRFLIATRPLDHAELAELRGRRIGDFELHTFHDADIEEFAGKWFRARQPDDAGTDDAASQFLSRVHEAELESVVRIPLLVTIAALVHERDREATLPTSRAGLYAQFVENLLRSRAGVQVPPESVLAGTGSREQVGKELLGWLTANLPALIEQVAFARLWTKDPRDVIALAVDLSESLSGMSPEGIEGWWRGRVRDAVLSSGVVTREGGGTNFVHQSIGEYLAAGPLLATSTTVQQLDWLDQPSTRGMALFAIARSRVAIDPMVTGLLAGQRTRLAGYLLIEGLAITRENATAIVLGLLDRIERDADDAVDCLALIEPILARPQFRSTVFDFVADPRRDPWARASVCDSVASSFSEQIVPAIRAIARDPAAPAEVRRWMADRLASLGDKSESLMAHVRWGGDAVSGDAAQTRQLIQNARRVAARDPKRTGQERVTAATALLRAGDPVGRETLLEIADFAAEPADRQLALFALLDAGEPVDPGLVVELVRVPDWSFGVRLRLMQVLAEADTPEGWTTLSATVADARATEAERTVATDLILAARQESAVPAQIALVENTDVVTPMRLEMAKALAGRGHEAGLRALTGAALDRTIGMADRWMAFAALVELPDRDRTVDLLRDILRRTPSEEQRQDWAVSMIGSHNDLAFEILAPPASGNETQPSRRMLAIAQLMKIDSQDSADALRSVVEQTSAPYRIRFAAFLALGRGHAHRCDLVGLLPLVTEPAKNFLMLAMLMVQAAELNDPRLAAAVRAMSVDENATDESRAAAAFGLARSGAAADPVPLVMVALDERNRAEVRLWAVQWVLTNDSELGIELVGALLRQATVPEGAQQFLLRLAAGLGDARATLVITEVARSRAVAPTCRLDAIYLLMEDVPDADVSADLADLVVEDRLALAQRIEAARLLGARHDETAGRYGWRLGTTDELEIACRGYALLAAAAADHADAGWFRSAAAVLVEPECPGDARRHIIDHLATMDGVVARDLLIELGASTKIGWDARAYAGLALLPRWPSEALGILRAVPGDQIPDWMYKMVQAATARYGAGRH